MIDFSAACRGQGHHEDHRGTSVGRGPKGRRDRWREGEGRREVWKEEINEKGEENVGEGIHVGRVGGTYAKS